MDQTDITAILRSALMAGGASLVTNGTLSESQLQQIVGGAIAVAAVAWSLWQKHMARRRLEIAAFTAADVATTHANNGIPVGSAVPDAATAGIDAAKATK